MNEDAVQKWIAKANNDLKIAKDELATDEPVTDMVCFHAQQCCEKYLKAFLIFEGKEYPRTHDLSALIHLCAKIDSDFQNLTQWRVDELTEYAVSIRYGEPFYIPSVAEAKEAIDLAEKVKGFVLDKLRQRGFRA